MNVFDHLNDIDLQRIEKSGITRSTLEYFSTRIREINHNSLLNRDRIETSGIPLNEINSSRDNVQSAVQALKNEQVGLIVLNGGMATRFGGVAKGTVDIDADLSFLGAKLLDARRVAQSVGAADPYIFLMCSSATYQPTLSHLNARKHFGYDPNKIVLFNQCESIRFTAKGDVFRDGNENPSFYGTGHGDLIYCIREVPQFQRFAEDGAALLLSNVDNVLATLDLHLLSDFLDAKEAVSVEVVDKNIGDVGGAPLLVDGVAKLIEAFRLPIDFDHEQVTVFNTNTLWIEPAALLNEAIELPWHEVRKTVDEQAVIQFERLIGELTHFVDTRFIRVERKGAQSRFIPVKTPDDLSKARVEILESWRVRQP